MRGYTVHHVPAPTCRNILQWQERGYRVHHMPAPTCSNILQCRVRGYTVNQVPAPTCSNILQSWVRGTQYTKCLHQHAAIYYSAMSPVNLAASCIGIMSRVYLSASSMRTMAPVLLSHPKRWPQSEPDRMKLFPHHVASCRQDTR